MLFYQPIPGQEEENLRYFTDSGLGESIKSSATIENWFRMLAESYSDVQQRRAQFSQPSPGSQPADCSSVFMQLLG
jgi:processive 1,2-diacylglycerol beta-glucosyltransferase